MENSVLFKDVFVGNNCVIKNSVILNGVYIGDNTHIENCIVESRDTIRADSNYIGEDGEVKIVVCLLYTSGKGNAFGRNWLSGRCSFWFRSRFLSGHKKSNTP